MALTVQERASAHAIAESLGLKHESFGDGEKRYLRVVPPEQQPPPKQRRIAASGQVAALEPYKAFQRLSRAL